MRVRAAATGAVMLGVCMVVASPAVADPAEVVTYSIHQDGEVKTDLDNFARKVRGTLNHKRGWSLNGRIDFRRISSGAEMRLVLASPAAVEAAAPGCSAQWSCRVGERVLINDRRWRNATKSWGLSVRAYQHYVVNHEVGHYLGLGHRHCPEPGAPAPVMQQQSIDKEGCRSNVWPRLSELKAAARHQGVTVPKHSPGASPKQEKSPKRPKPTPAASSPDHSAEASPTVSEKTKPQKTQSPKSKRPIQQTAPTRTPTPVQAEALSPPPSAQSTPGTALSSARQTLPTILLAVLTTLVVVGAVGGSVMSMARRRRGGDG